MADPQVVRDDPDPDPQPRTTVSFLPIAFNAQTLWQSPCFWMVVGSALTLAAIWTFNRKGQLR